MLILDRYKPTYEAGSGGFATVIVARDTVIRREVAIKCLPLETASNQQLSAEEINAGLEALKNPYDSDASVSIMGEDASAAAATIPGLEEARTAALLNDANIVSIYDFEIQGNMAYIIMELVDGISLTDLMRYFPEVIDADVVAAVFKAVSHALEVAHKNHVLHLDIKPDNVLINRDGQVKVVDFGLARLADGFGFGVATGGTIGYMPPEQMEREELDERCDQWALASLTYEMLARGENPFKADSVEEALDVLYETEIVIPSLCMDGVAEELDDALFQALDPDKEGRYPTIKAFAKDVRPALGNAKQGAKKLAALVSYAISGEDAECAGEVYTDAFGEDETEYEHDQAENTTGIYPLNLRKRTKRKSARAELGSSSQISTRYSLALRIIALIGATLVTAVAFSNFSLLPGWDSPMLWGALLIVMVAAFALPHVGALVSFSLLGLALVNNNAILAGALVVIATFAWWILVGREGSTQADAAFLSTCASSIGFGSATPLVCAYFLKPAQACATALFSSLIAIVLAGLGSVSITSWDAFQLWNVHSWTEASTNILTTISNPITWAIIVSWVVSAPIVSLFLQHESTVLNILGIVVGVIITCALPAVASTVFLAHDPDPIYLALTIASGTVMAVVATIFPAKRN